MEVDVPAEDVMLRIGAVLNGQDAGPGGIHILVACAPKSGSSFLAGAISRLPGFHRADLVLGYGGREQELCLFHCAAAHAVSYVAQHHVRYSETTDVLMRGFRLFPVLLGRNLFDTVVSLRDHMREKSFPSPMAHIDESFRGWDDQSQLDFVIDFCLPWYANFLASWSLYQGPCVRLLYKDVIGRPVEMIELIAQAAGAPCPRADIEAAIAAVSDEEARLNVGRVGRGEETLSARQIDRIRALFKPYETLPAVSAVLELKRVA